MGWTKEENAKIEDNLSKLIDCIECNATLMAALVKFLTKEEKQQIMKKETSQDQAFKLFDVMQTKVGGFQGLLDALEKAKQTEPLQILQPNAHNSQGPPPAFIIGSKGYTFDDVNKSLLGCNSATIVLSRWKEVARDLPLSAVDIHEIQKQLDRSDIGQRDIFYKVLEQWKNAASDKATLAKLIDVLKGLGLQDAADTLKKLI